MNLPKINERYESILQTDISDQTKSERLAELMTEMERQYNIPMLKKLEWEWEGENKAIIALYRKISMSRKI